MHFEFKFSRNHHQKELIPSAHDIIFIWLRAPLADNIPALNMAYVRNDIEFLPVRVQNPMLFYLSARYTRLTEEDFWSHEKPETR